MSEPEDYGRFYWCAKVTKDIAADGEIYVYADGVCTRADGAVEFTREQAPEGKSHTETLLVLAAGQWVAVYPASVLDGSAVAVEHWTGEVERSRS